MVCFGLRELPRKLIRLGDFWAGLSWVLWDRLGLALGLGEIILNGVWGWFLCGACWRVAVLTLQVVFVLPWLSVGWFVF